MNYYKEMKRQERNRKIVRGIKIAVWCALLVMWIGHCGSVELADKLAIGMHP